MSKYTERAILTAVVILLSFHLSAQIINDQWTWIKGDNSINQYGVYGTKGVASSTNKPGARQFASTWTDNAGNLWLFGGDGYVATGSFSTLNDLWMYTPVTNMWTWINGDNTLAQYGIYGTQGVTVAGNKPGARNGAVIWKDNTGLIWLFGGTGLAASGSSGRLNDLWKYDPATNMWTWIKGDNAVNQGGIYGALGTGAATNKPGGRVLSCSWIDSGGNMWLFGGNGYDAANNQGELGDLWEYNVGTNQWTWIKGSNTRNPVAVYGTQGVSSSTNLPGARNGGVAWVDSQDNLWLMGGSGFDGNTTLGNLNDLWKYNSLANEWVWIKGDNTINQPGAYGTKGISSAANKPGARDVSAGWKDRQGNLWVFGGAASGGNLLNDLWKYEPGTNLWTWMSGDNSTNVAGIYGTQGISGSNNKPGSSQGSSAWMDALGNLWLFGGRGYDATSSLGRLNNLWAYGASEYVWVGVTSSDWNTGSNWSNGLVPTINNNVIIPASTPFSPIVYSGITASCKNLSVLTGASITVQLNGTLNISH